jgi:hypothetical protein
MITDQKKPVATPSYIASHLPMTWHVDEHAGSFAIAHNVVHRDGTVRVQDRAHCSDGCLNPMLARSYAFHMGQRGHKTDRAVAAHAQITYIVEKDHSGRTAPIDGLAQQCADHYVGAPRLVDHRRPKRVVLIAKPLQSLRQSPGPEVRAAAHHQPRWFPTGVGIDHADSSDFLSTHKVLFDRSVLTSSEGSTSPNGLCLGLSFVQSGPLVLMDTTSTVKNETIFERDSRRPKQIAAPTASLRTCLLQTFDLVNAHETGDLVYK